jgi:hypothetical protein
MSRMSVRASTPAKPMLLVLYRRLARSPLIQMSGSSARRACSSLSRSLPTPIGLLLHFELGDAAGFAEADDGRDVERAAAETALLAAAVDERLQLDLGLSVTDEKGPDALGAAQLMSGERGEVDVVRSDINRNLAHCLREITEH